MLQTLLLLLMKSLNKTQTPIFLSEVCSLFPRSICLTYSEKKNTEDEMVCQNILPLFCP